MTHILIWPSTNPSPFIPPTTASYKHKRDALPDRLTIYFLFQEAHSFLKAPLKPNGRVSSYLHPWHRLGFLPGQGCLAHMHKIARDSPKPPIRDKLICCILLQGHFLNCLLEGDLASKLLSSPARTRAPCSPLAVPHWLLSLEKLHPFMWGCHAQLSKAQVNQACGAWVDPLWKQEGCMRMQDFLCVQHSSISALPSLPQPDGWNKDHLEAACYNSAMRGRSESTFLSWMKFTSLLALCLHKSRLERQLPNLERWGDVKQHIHVLLNDLSTKDTPSSGPSALQHNVIKSVVLNLFTLRLVLQLCSLTDCNSSP